MAIALEKVASQHTSCMHPLYSAVNGNAECLVPATVYPARTACCLCSPYVCARRVCLERIQTLPDRESDALSYYADGSHTPWNVPADGVTAQRRSAGTCVGLQHG